MLLQTILEGLGLTTKENIKRNAMRFKIICIPMYLAYVLACVYAINGTQGFWISDFCLKLEKGGKSHEIL